MNIIHPSIRPFNKIELGPGNATVNKKVEAAAVTELTFRGDLVGSFPAIQGQRGGSHAVFYHTLSGSSIGTLPPHLS